MILIFNEESSHIKIYSVIWADADFPQKIFQMEKECKIGNICSGFKEMQKDCS